MSPIRDLNVPLMAVPGTALTSMAHCVCTRLVVLEPLASVRMCAFDVCSAAFFSPKTAKKILYFILKWRYVFSSRREGIGEERRGRG